MSVGIDVSILIPTHNRLWCLPQAIASCRATKCQTEIIVMDDGSTDGTWDWLRQQPGMIALQQPNSGKCSAVNKIFSLAKGKYVKFLDSDDLVDQQAIDEEFELAESTNCDLVVSGYQVIDEHGVVMRRQQWINCDDFMAQQLGECDGSHYSAFLFRKDLIQAIPHRDEYAYRDDRMLLLEVALKQPKIAIHNGTALLHRTHQNSRLQISKGKTQVTQNKQHLDIYKTILGRLQQNGQLTKRRINAASLVLWPLCHWIAKHDIDEATNAFKWLCQIDPDFTIPGNALITALYRTIGFKQTEKMLSLRRRIKYLIKINSHEAVVIL